MNLGYWGYPLRPETTTEEPARAMPTANAGPVFLVDAGTPQQPAISDSTVVSLTIPAGASHALVQINGGVAWYNTTGVDPVIATGNGFKVADLTFIELYGYDQMSKFRVRAHTGVTGKVFVQYYKFQKVNKAP